MENISFIGIARRWWWALALGCVVGGLGGFGFASVSTPTYEGVAKVLVGPIATDRETLQASGELSRTYAELATSRPVLSAAIRESGATTTVEDVIKNETVKATSNEVTRLVEIRAQDEDAGVSARFANALSERIKLVTSNVPSQQSATLDEFSRSDEVLSLPRRAQEDVLTAARRVLGRSLAGTVEVVDPAEPPLEAVAPAVKLMVILAALAGLVAVAVLVLLREAGAAGRLRGGGDLVGLDEQLLPGREPERSTSGVA